MAPIDALRSALPEYDITDELGRGGMGVVYLGRQRALDRTVAIKLLPSSFAADERVRQRFVTEARVVASLDHPHVVVVHDFVERSGVLALVMEALPNGTVWDQFVSEGLGAPKACGLALATLAGVQHAHERGVMHRDIKPENLMFTHDWQVKVTDFGIAQVLSGNVTMGTPEGAILGTPAYMAPEQAEGRVCGPPADVYATGAMLYEMLSGTLPFPGHTAPMRMALARLSQDPVPLAAVAPSVPEAIREITMHALARTESARFESAEAFGVALGEAAAEAWGPEWMTETGTAVLGNPAIEHASRTIRHTHGAATDPALEVEAVLEDLARPEPRPTISVSAMRPVVPAEQARVGGADLNLLRPADFVQLSEVRPPGSPVPALLLAAILIAATLVVAAVGLGDDPEATNAETVTLAARRVAVADRLVEYDFADPVPVNIEPVDGLDATFLGIPIGSVSVTDGELDPDYLQWTAAGVVELAGEVAGTDVSFPVRATNRVWTSAPFVASALIALGALASVQANLRGMRSRRIRIGPYVGLVLSGAVSGAALAVLAIIVLETPASYSSIVAAAVLGGIGAVALGEGYRRWRRRRRLARVLVASARRA